MASNEAFARLVWQEEVHFSAETGNGHVLELDGNPEPTSQGPSPMELVLTALAGCSSMDVISILRKKRQDVRDLKINAHGVRAEEYPKVFTSITLEYVVTGKGIDPLAVERAIELARTKYCPVWAMLGKAVEITPTYRIIAVE